MLMKSEKSASEQITAVVRGGKTNGGISRYSTFVKTNHGSISGYSSFVKTNAVYRVILLLFMQDNRCMYSWN